MIFLDPNHQKTEHSIFLVKFHISKFKIVTLNFHSPPLRVKTDGDTGQMVVSGMGELHLEIIKDRLLREYKLEVYLGPTLVAYRECIDKSSSVIHHTLQE